MIKKETPLRKFDTSRLLQEITDTLAHWEGKDIAEKAEEILGHPVKYLGDDLYEVKELIPGIFD